MKPLNLYVTVIKNKTKKKVLKEDLERAKKECNKLSHMLQNNIQSYEKKISDLKEQHEIEVSELKRREEEFIKSNEELMDTDIYTVYKDIKRKFTGYSKRD
jgi:CTP-dependent riboflavin kinase